MNYIGAIIGSVIAVIIMVTVAYPVIKATVDNQSATATGTTKTILDLLPLFVVIGALVLVVGAFISR